MAASHPSALKYGTINIDAPSVPTVTKLAVDMNVPGLAVGDTINFHPPVGMNDDLIYAGCRVKAANTATVFIYNPTAGPLDDGFLVWEYEWWDLT
jgi:hypothetical protein